jgi:hypothetical protein
MGLARLARSGDIRSTAMSAMENRQIELKPDQIAYLDEAVKAFGLPDTGKALRILINYARENPDKRNEIFGDIHCTGDC